MKDLYNDMAEFSFKAFPDADEKDHLVKLIHEATEARVSCKDIEEYADCLLALFGACAKAGISYSKLILTAKGKMEVNKARTWERQKDGTYQHTD